MMIVKVSRSFALMIIGVLGFIILPGALLMVWAWRTNAEEELSKDDTAMGGLVIMGIVLTVIWWFILIQAISYTVSVYSPQ